VVCCGVFNALAGEFSVVVGLGLVDVGPVSVGPLSTQATSGPMDRAGRASSPATRRFVMRFTYPSPGFGQVWRPTPGPGR